MDEEYVHGLDWAFGRPGCEGCGATAEKCRDARTRGYWKCCPDCHHDDDEETTP